MIKEFFMKQVAKQALKNAPVSEEQKNMMLEMVSKNPQLFQKIVEESQKLMTEKGLDQMTAVMQVAQKYQAELKGLMNK